MGQAFRSALAGAAAGFTGSIIGMGGISIFGKTFSGVVLTGMFDGLISGVVARGVTNLLTEKDFLDGFSLQAAITDAVVGGLMSGFFYGTRRISESGELRLRWKYSESYIKRIQDTYQSLKNAGIEATEHSINRLLGRSARGITVENVIDTYQSGEVFFDPKYGIITKFKNGIATSQDILTGILTNVQSQIKPTARWIRIPWQ